MPMSMHLCSTLGIGDSQLFRQSMFLKPPPATTIEQSHSITLQQRSKELYPICFSCEDGNVQGHSGSSESVAKASDRARIGVVSRDASCAASSHCAREMGSSKLYGQQEIGPMLPSQGMKITQRRALHHLAAFLIGFLFEGKSGLKRKYKNTQTGVGMCFRAVLGRGQAEAICCTFCCRGLIKDMWAD